MAELLLGIDVGTYSSKGVLVQPDGNVLRSEVVDHTIEIPHPGWAEQDADAIWWADVTQLCHKLLDGAPYRGDDVAAVALSAIGPCMLPLDANGKPLRPGILYGVDTRAAAEIDYLNQKLGEAEIFDFSGMALTSQSIGPKILWMKNHEPELWKKVDHITTASSYLIYRLTGEKVIDRHTASHFMPLIDIRRLEWSDRYSAEIIETRKLPELKWSDELAGVVNQAGAEATGLKPGTPVAVGAVDALSEAVSVGVVEPGDLMIMYGSTTFFILVMNEPIHDRRMWTVAGAFPRQYCLAAGMATTGSLTRWFRDEFTRELSEDLAYATLFSEAERIEPGAGGLILLPYFSGERTPINDPKAKGVIAGLTLAHTRAHLYRAILEGVAYGIRHNLETFESINAKVARVVAVGGGTKSKTWLQIVSDAAGVEQMVPEQTIGASYGDAFLAGLAVGMLKKPDLSQWVKPGITVSPIPANQEVYQRLYPNFLELYERTKDIAHQL
ncbi:MAG: FGGY-family carbohydrate kinase [Anaerolineae bacterium]|nr:FGGY-family carbohydrate kinase [Anaerolineae bacterium]